MSLWRKLQEPIAAHAPASIKSLASCTPKVELLDLEELVSRSRGQAPGVHLETTGETFYRTAKIESEL